jgi:23S rRNA pseudouridine2605 synthase
VASKTTHIPLCRLLSKRGLASRKQAVGLARAGRVCVDGVVVRDAEQWVRHESHIEIDGVAGETKAHRVYMMNKKRRVISSRSDEFDREVVYDHPLLCDGTYAAVGRLDKASEGLLLFTNDSQLANRLTSPDTHIDKIYHVKINRLLRDDELEFLGSSIDLDGELTLDSRWTTLRHGEKTSWLEVRLREGKNRQIRRMLEEIDVTVDRLIRVGIGELVLGTLLKGHVRELSADEVLQLARSTRSAGNAASGGAH